MIVFFRIYLVFSYLEKNPEKTMKHYSFELPILHVNDDANVGYSLNASALPILTIYGTANIGSSRSYQCATSIRNS